MTKEEQKFELEKHLHEQYAINNNAHSSHFISFLAALLVLFGVFGYIYVYSNSLVPIEQHVQDGIYSVDVFLLLSVVVSGVLFFLAKLCLSIGYAQRRDNMIIAKIRGNNNFITGYDNPREKSYWEFIPDYYNLFYWLFFTAQIFVLILTLIKCFSSYCATVGNSCNCSLHLYIIFALSAQGIFIALTLYKREKAYKKYCSFKERKELDIDKENEKKCENTGNINRQNSETQVKNEK